MPESSPLTSSVAYRKSLAISLFYKVHDILKDGEKTIQILQS